MTLLEQLKQKKAEGARLRAFRRLQGWTQVELAAQLGLHANTVARMERGVVPITGRTWAQLVALNGGKHI